MGDDERDDDNWVDALFKGGVIFVLFILAVMIAYMANDWNTAMLK